VNQLRLQRAPGARQAGLTGVSAIQQCGVWRGTSVTSATRARGLDGISAI
jgi:hypothetical protein